MGNYKTTRPIVKLYPLEVRNEDENNLHTTSDDNVQHPQDPQPLLDNTLHYIFQCTRTKRGCHQGTTEDVRMDNNVMPGPGGCRKLTDSLIRIVDGNCMITCMIVICVVVLNCHLYQSR